jgi:subtilase family protein
VQGLGDLRAGLASTPAAQQVLELERSVHGAAELEALDQNLDAIFEWAHGTHVAGIMLAGVPKARLAVFRSAWAGESRPYHHRGPTDDELAAERRNVEAIADFIHRNHVKVVNASLGFTTDYLEGELRYQTELYPTEAAVRARARAVHAKRREAWAWIFQACPDTLFVIAAGNENHDVVEYGDVAASIAAPNVVVVGAVDEVGNWAPFTSSNPEIVRLFDYGVGVPSVIPNGERVPLSGTSMASPNAANLAVKLYAVDPDLTPARAIAAMVETADPIAAPFNGGIPNEERALTRIRRER